MRGQLTESDDTLRNARADLETKRAEPVEKEVELAGKRIELAEQGVGIAEEALAHMREWRYISGMGLAALGILTLFSMLAVTYVLVELMPNDKVSDAAAPIIIFVLALFAISPAVLLLLERPFEGLDKWSPSGGAGTNGDSSSEGEDGPTAATDAAETKATTTPTTLPARLRAELA